MPKPRPFTREEDDFIRAHLGAMPHRDIADHLHRSLSGVRKRVCAMGLSRGLRRWTGAEDTAIRDAAGSGERLADLASRLGRGLSETSSRVRFLGLAPWRQYRRGPWLDRNGHVVERFDRSRNRYVLRHRVVMEEVLGRPLRPGEVVHHISTDKLDNQPGNLYLCADAAEHQRVHRSIERLLPELFRAGIISFNRDRGAYELCQIHR